MKIKILADIETDTNCLAQNIREMTDEMDEMSNGVSESAKKIETINKNGSNSTVSYIRKQAKRAAKFVDNFSGKLKNHNVIIEKLWNRIEKNTLGLLENEYATYNNNKQSLMQYLNSLNGMKIAISESNTNVEKLKISMNNNIGLEKSMNQAIRFCVEDLTTYIEITERISISIDKILRKSKFVV